MNTKEAYYEVFRILDEYWSESKLDDLGCMLSEMSPYTFSPDEYVSADPAVYDEWNTAWRVSVGTDRDASSEQVYQLAKDLMKYYSQELKYDLGNASNYLAEELGIDFGKKKVAL
jgi:hypothetical protein